MKVNRRFALQGLATVGIAMYTVNWTSARSLGLGESASSVLAIVSGSTLDADFLSGLHTAMDRGQWLMHPTIHLKGFESAAFVALNTELQTQPPSMLLGLTDNASAIVILDLVRSAGGQMQSSHPYPSAPALASNASANKLLSFCCTF